MSSQIDITAAEPGIYAVQVTEGDTKTSHRVRISPRVIDLVGQGQGAREAELEEALVRQSFEFLLEREPAEEILDTFSLEDIAKYFPEYNSEIVERFQA